MVLDVRSVKRYPRVGAVARRRQEGEGTAEAKSHHGNFTVTLGMLLEIGDHVGKVSHAQLEIVPVVAREGALPAIVVPGQRARVCIPPEHVRGGCDKPLARERVCVIRHVAVNTGNSRHDDHGSSLFGHRRSNVGIKLSAVGGSNRYMGPRHYYLLSLIPDFFLTVSDKTPKLRQHI